jgi:hypothetical protein
MAVWLRVPAVELTVAAISVEELAIALTASLIVLAIPD